MSKEKQEQPIIIKNPFKFQKEIDMHLRIFGHLPDKCGGSGLKCPLKERQEKDEK